MVKGVSRQVIVVRSLDTKLFEQAIFMIRDGAAARQGITDEDIMREANAAADACLREHTEPVARKRGIRIFWAACGALITGAAWLLTVLL